MNPIRSTCCLLMAILFFNTGCGAPKPAPNPLQGGGWKLLPSQDANKLSKAIRDDYQDYIQGLPAEPGSFIGDVFFFENGTGQHAVSIERGVRGKYWYHILFYDQNDRRTKVVKYAHGGYMS